MAGDSLQTYTIGQRVQCRDIGENWRTGEVVSISPFKVRADGWEQSFEWEEVRNVEDNVVESSEKTCKYRLAMSVQTFTNGGWLDGKVIQVLDSGNVTVLGRDNTITEVSACSEHIREKPKEQIPISSPPDKNACIPEAQNSVEIKIAQLNQTLELIPTKTPVSSPNHDVAPFESPDLFADLGIVDPLDRLRDYDQGRLEPKKLDLPQEKLSFEASKPPTSPESKPASPIPQIKKAASPESASKQLPVVMCVIPIAASIQSTTKRSSKSRKSRQFRQKKGFMQATKSSRSRFCEKENAVVIVNLVHRGKKIGRIGVCEGDNAYELADDFLKKRRDLPSAKRNALAKILIHSLEPLTKW